MTTGRSEKDEEYQRQYMARMAGKVPDPPKNAPPATKKKKEKPAPAAKKKSTSSGGMREPSKWNDSPASAYSLSNLVTLAKPNFFNV